MTTHQIVDLAAFGIELFDLGSEFLLIHFERTALQQRDLQRVDAEDLLEVLVILIKIAEVDTELILQDADADRAVDEVAAVQLDIQMQIRFIVVGEFLLCGPCGDGKPRELDRLTDGFFRDARKACDIDDRRNAVDILETRDIIAVQLAADACAAEYVADAVTGECAALQDRENDLVDAAGNDLVPEDCLGLIARVLEVLVELVFGDEFIEASIREEVYALAVPCFAADAGGLCACKDLHRRNAPHLFEVGLVAAVVRACDHIAFDMEKVFREKLSVFLFALFLCDEVAQEHLRGCAEEFFLEALLFGLHRRDALADVIKHAAQTEEVFDALLHTQLEADRVALLEAHIDGFLNGRQEGDIDLILQQQREKTGYKGKRSQSIEHVVGYADVEFAFFAAGRQDQAADDVVLECIQHSLGIGSGLDGMYAAFPRRLYPENGFNGKCILLLGEQDRCVILIRCQRDHLAEFLDRARIFPF